LILIIRVKSFATEVAVAKNTKPPVNTDIDYKVQSFAAETSAAKNTKPPE